MNEKIVIRCLTEKSKGFGNFTRAFTVGEELRRKGFEIIFLVNKNKIIINKLQKKNICYNVIPQKFSYKTEWQYINNFMNSIESKVILLDMREYSDNICKKLFKKNFKVIVIDDAFCKKTYADIIFNGTLPSKHHNYEIINKNSKLYLGLKYFIAKKEFYHYKKIISNIKKKKKYNVVISMGGSDPKNFTYFILKSITSLPQIEITVIIGPFFKNIEKIRKLIKDKKNVKLKFDPNYIWKEFHKADVVITKSGITLYELAMLRIPTICLVMFEHEAANAQLFMKKGFVKNLGKKKNIKSKQIEEELKSMLEDTQKRKKMSKVGGKIVDGKGLERIIQIITENVRE